jgi:thioredoxin 1
MIHTALLNQENFGQITSEKDLLLVYITAPWCGPCKMLSPVVDNICDEMDSKITLAKIDADENMELVKSLNVRNIPTLLFYKKGEVVERTTGVKTKSELTKILETLKES